MAHEELVLSAEKINELRNIKDGVYAPLSGFLKKKDFESVCTEMRLSNGAIWPIPIILDIDQQTADRLKKEDEVLLKDEESKIIGLLKDIEIYEYDKERSARLIFGTADRKHPGVDEFVQMKNYLLGGELETISLPEVHEFREYYFRPVETKKIFHEKGWKTIAAFQTRNVPHRGHEFLHQQALSVTDGLFLQPIVGRKKLADFKDEYILASYEMLFDHYYPQGRAILAVAFLKMRYAGPREAVFHALVRRNYGCTHFIVGRDHAGVGNYYLPFAAQQIFDSFSKKELGIEILKFPEVVWCSGAKRHRFAGECITNDDISFSATLLRDLIEKKEQPPSFLLRPEIFYLLSCSRKPLIDQWYQSSAMSKKGGFVLWFTGLSQSGKTTIANNVFRFIEEAGWPAERLDGDDAREYLSSDLGFSKADRDENIRRVATLAALFTKRGVAVVCSFISPYAQQRSFVRKKVEEAGGRFIEVFCDCPLEICEKRDTKGLYQKARLGRILHFTGISDPYEPPEQAEVHLFTHQLGAEENALRVIKFVKENLFNG